MMNSEKINAQHLVTEVARKTGETKKDMDLFLREFIALIEEALYKDKIVKVKGLGTFKLIWNESRKSVNVQTGAEIEIAGHYKVTFTAEGDLRDFVNEPFAHLETVILDGGDDDPQPEEKKDNPDPLRNLSSQAQEIASLISELNSPIPPQDALLEYENTSENVDDKQAEIAVAASGNEQTETAEKAVEETVEKTEYVSPAEPVEDENIELIADNGDAAVLLAEIRKIAYGEPETGESATEVKTEEADVVVVPVVLPEDETSSAEQTDDEPVSTETQAEEKEEDTETNYTEQKDEQETFIAPVVTYPVETEAEKEPELSETTSDEVVQEEVKDEQITESAADNEVLTPVEPEYQPQDTVQEKEQVVSREDATSVEEKSEPKEEEKKKKARPLILDIFLLLLILFLLGGLIFSCFYKEDCYCYKAIMKKEKAAAIVQDDQQIPAIPLVEEDVSIPEPILFYEEPEFAKPELKEIPGKFEPGKYKVKAHAVVEKGTHLALLSEQHYKNYKFWPYIFLANKDILSDPNRLKLGQRIKILELPKSIVDPDDEQSILKAEYIGEHLSEY